MAHLWNYAHAEEAWIMAASGDHTVLDEAFAWVTTKEGHDYWWAIRRGETPYTPDIIERVRLMYVEWKVAGDFDENAG